MTIQQLDEKRVIIALCKEDMEMLSLKYSTMCFADRHSRSVLKRLLCVAASRTGISISNCSTVVEALPGESGGCLLIVTLLPRGTHPKRYRILHCNKTKMFTFDTLEDLLCCTHQLYIHGYRPTSSAYGQADKYYLTVNMTKDVPKDAIYILREYAPKETENKLQVAAICEYGRLLAADNAIWRIGNAMHR